MSTAQINAMLYASNAHYHVRAIGYAGFFLLVGLIALGFSTRRTGLAALGALALPIGVVAAQDDTPDTGDTTTITCEEQVRDRDCDHDRTGDPDRAGAASRPFRTRAGSPRVARRVDRRNDR